MSENASYQVQYRRCNKQNCSICWEGKGHGPYKYAYWRDNATGRLRSRYMGRVGVSEYHPPNRKDNKERAELFTQQWLELKSFYNNTCLSCNKQEPEIVLEIDHVIPLSRNGVNDISNIQPLCRLCNARKGTKTTDYRLGYDPEEQAKLKQIEDKLALETQQAMMPPELPGTPAQPGQQQQGQPPDQQQAPAQAQGAKV